MSELELFGPNVTEADIAYVTDALRNGWYGPNKYWYVEEFEKVFKSYHNRSYGLMTSNCTSAIHLAGLSLGLTEGDEVIVPDLTWIGSISGLNACGVKLIFCDVDPLTWCIDVARAEKLITDKTKAILAVNLYGNMADWISLGALAKKFNLKLIEDAAESLGSVVMGKKSGSFGDISVFSFHRTKTLTTGEGGFYLTNNESLFNTAAFHRDHGRSSSLVYFNDEVTVKYMPSNMMAALAYGQFQRIDELILIKRRLFKACEQFFSDLDDIVINSEPPEGSNGVWGTCIIWGKSYKINKEDMMERLERLGFQARPFFYPLTSMPAVINSRHHEVGYKIKNHVAYSISRRGICLPAAMNLQPSDVEKYCEAVKKILLESRQ